MEPESLYNLLQAPKPAEEELPQGAGTWRGGVGWGRGGVGMGVGGEGGSASQSQTGCAWEHASVQVATGHQFCQNVRLQLCT